MTKETIVKAINIATLTVCCYAMNKIAEDIERDPNKGCIRQSIEGGICRATGMLYGGLALKVISTK